MTSMLQAISSRVRPAVAGGVLGLVLGSTAGMAQAAVSGHSPVDTHSVTASAMGDEDDSHWG